MNPSAIRGTVARAQARVVAIVQPYLASHDWRETIVHRERRGLVRLDLRTRAEVENSWTALRRAVAKEAGKTDWQGALVSEMVPPGIDVFLGLSVDRDWGPLLAIGPGGFNAEQADEIALVSLPATAREIRDALRRTRFWRALRQGRRDGFLDEAALVGAAQRLAQLGSILPGATSVDVNPLRVRAKGGGAIALDSFVQIASNASTQPAARRGRPS